MMTVLLHLLVAIFLSIEKVDKSSTQFQDIVGLQHFKMKMLLMSQMLKCPHQHPTVFSGTVTREIHQI
jgi:hypothetical protein